MSYSFDKNISDEMGNPVSDLKYYWPVFLFIDYDRMHSFSYIDSARNYHLSDFLSANSEPVLSNIFLGKEIVRLTVIRSFKPAYLIRIEHDGKSVQIHEKKLKKIDMEQFKVNESQYSIPKNFYNQAKFKYELDKVRDFSKDKWESLVSLIQSSNLDKLKVNNSSGMDGSHFLLEVHTKHGWIVLDRWSPDKGIDKAFISVVNFILKESKINDNIEDNNR